MNQDSITITVVNWDKFNPRKDLKATSWFRMQNSIFEDPDFFDFSHAEFSALFYILCQCSKKQCGTIRVNYAHANRIGRLDTAELKSAIDKLVKIQFVQITNEVRHADVTSTSHARNTTNERTDETDGRTDTGIKKPPTLSKEILGSCCKTWIETLAHFKIQRPLNPTEQEQIGRAIQRWGAEFVDLSLYGARYEPCHEGFNPKDHVSLGRIFEKDKFGKYRIDKFVNWASQRKAKQTLTVQPAETEENEPPPDPDKVRAILAAAGFGRKI